MDSVYEFRGRLVTMAEDPNYPLRVYIKDLKTGKVTEHFHKVKSLLRKVSK